MSSQSDVANDLRDIEDMASRLEAKAIDQGRRVGTNDDRGIVGGEALVNLVTSSPRRWAEQVDVREQAWHDDPELDDDDMPNWSEYEDPDEMWPAISLLTYWSEDARRQLGMQYEGWRPTLLSEVKFLRNRDVADWMREQFGWDDYAADVKKAKTKLETVLTEGERVAFRGIECMYDDCKGARLIRKTEPTASKTGDKVYRLSDWFCPKCKRSWSPDDYVRRIYAKIEATHWANLDDETWCTTDRAARRVARPEGTVRSWSSRNQVATVCLLDVKLGRPTMVRLEDVHKRDELAKERRARWLAARMRAS